MIIKIAEYKIKKEKLREVSRAIRRFVSAVRAHEPTTVYEAYRRGKSFEFVHLMKFSDTDAERIHATARYTEEFVKTLYPNCAEGPLFTALQNMG